MDHAQDWAPGFEEVVKVAKQKNLSLLVVTADADKAQTLFLQTNIVKCDATVLKTAARVTPTYFIMQGPNVIEKISYLDADLLLKAIDQLK